MSIIYRHKPASGQREEAKTETKPGPTGIPFKPGDWKSGPVYHRSPRQRKRVNKRREAARMWQASPSLGAIATMAQRVRLHKQGEALLQQSLQFALPAEIKQGNLPMNYEAACRAVQECVAVDECKEMGDQAAAIASYARMAKDPTLEHLALRIRDRAVRRCGEILQTFRAQGRRTDQAQPDPAELPGGNPRKLETPPQTQAEAGGRAGLSPDQIVQAVRVASVPEKDFERMVEANPPATISALAAAGREARVPDEIISPQKPPLTDEDRN